MKLHELAPAEGARREGFRVGRGPASGNGKTSGRGHKGQKSRSGYSRKRGFEGGQMPLKIRLPKRGFNNRFATPLTAINLSVLEGFEAGSTVTAELLLEKRILRKCPHGLKVLGNGEIKAALTIVADSFSASAKEKIEAAGGKCETKR
ncbi:MAG: 50S ribosomal protein L15 [Oscillospiraceae bacterium]|jgi:large subunit ribosomal protein L15|nr:50S ribosomal protein L15 [Oscillospiraceae bacterium]